MKIEVFLILRCDVKIKMVLFLCGLFSILVLGNYFGKVIFINSDSRE